MKSRAPNQSPPRKNRLLREHVHDTYKFKRKPSEPTVCPACRAVYFGGRWQWIAQPADAEAHTCPACHRIQDKYPAGSLTLSGEFLTTHRDEILNLARNTAEGAKAEHPLKRIIAIEDAAGSVVITTTDAHLARGIGEALYRAYSGDLDLRYLDDSDLLRVTWTR